jgi:tripartite ATP-independent transporter DctM subunit
MNTVVHSDLPARPALRAGLLVERLEAVVCSGALLGMVLLPIGDLLLRAATRSNIPGAVEYTQHLSLWVGFFGAVVAARQGRHLCLATPSTANRLQRFLTATLSATVSLCLAAASWQFLASEFHAPERIGGWLPIAAAASVLPMAFALMSVHFIARAGGWRVQALAFCAALAFAGVFHVIDGAGLPVESVAILVGLLVLGAVVGLPIFITLGGIALVLFYGDGVPAAAIPVETYRLVVSPSIPAIPLFTLTGFVLASGNAANRLVRLFNALLGWLPGGTVIAATLVCAFFSAFTGASGVTILALGGLLLPALRAAGNGESFSTGLITSTGSIGLLFPPSLAVILYGVVAQVPIPDLFRAGALPGVLMVAAICVYGVLHARRNPSPRVPFDGREALSALWESRFELLLPVGVLTALFGGFATLIEAAAMSALYVIVIEVAVRRDLGLRHDLPRLLLRCATLLGGVFAIIGVAMGLTSYLVDAMIPMKLVAWVGAHVGSRVEFLLMLNALLLVVGCMMDIFSAIFVVLPLIIPASQLFHVDPLHLGMIFLLNLEIGYLTPPVGMNLFLASYRLEKPMVEVSRSVLPFLVVLAAVLLLITFIPSLVPGAH